MAGRYFLLFIIIPTFLISPFSFSFGAEGMEMTHHLGFNGVFRLNGWTPLTVTVENRRQAFKGLLEVQVFSGSEYRNDVRQTTYTTEADLPFGSKKTFHLTLFIDSYAHPLTIRLINEKETLLTKSLNLRGAFVNQPLLVFAGDNPADLSSLGGDSYCPLFSPVNLLPESWYGYQEVQGLVIAADLLHHLRPRQFQALRRWIQAGGQVITSGSLSLSPLAQERLDQLLSLQVRGVAQLRALSAFRSFSGQPLQAREPFLLLKVSSPETAIILREGELPLILEKKLGMGKIIFISLDISEAPFRNWSGQTGFWKKLLLQPPDSRAPLHPAEDRLFPLLLLNKPGRFPNFFLTLFFCLVYMLTLSLFFKKIEKEGGPGKSFLFILTLTVILGSLTAWGLGFLSQARHNQSLNGFFHLKINSSLEINRWKYYLGLYSQKDGDFRIPLTSDTLPGTYFPTQNPDTMRFQGYTLHDGHDRFLFFPQKRWTHRFCTLSLLGPAPFKTEVDLQEERLSLVLENRSPAPIQFGHIFFRDHVFPLGALAPGKRKIQTWKVGPLKSSPDLILQDITTQLSLVKNRGPSLMSPELKQALARDLWNSLLEQNRDEKDRIIMVAWMDSMIYPPEAGVTLPIRKGAGLVEWEIPLKNPLAPLAVKE